MTEKLFKKSMKLADVIDANYQLLFVLPRFGIKLGFGDVSIADICKKHEVNEDVFVLICNIYTFEDYLPKLSEMNNVSLEYIMFYLKQSHNDYLTKKIPHILGHIENLADEAHSRQRGIIKQFCDNYKKEVAEHFNYEEKTVFPYIESLIKGINGNKYKIDDFLHNHSNLDDKLHDLKSIIMKYIEPKADEITSDLLMDIYLLEEDLKRHTTIEEKILAALAETIETER